MLGFDARFFGSEFALQRLFGGRSRLFNGCDRWGDSTLNCGGVAIAQSFDRLSMGDALIAKRGSMCRNLGPNIL